MTKTVADALDDVNDTLRNLKEPTCDGVTDCDASSYACEWNDQQLERIETRLALILAKLEEGSSDNA